MADCQWTRIAGGKLQCKECGYIYQKRYDKDPAKLHRNCPQSKGIIKNPRITANTPDPCAEEDERLAKEGAERLGVSWKDCARYTIALARWGKAGFLTRSDEEVKRFEVTCRKCEHYRDGRCKKCGCRVNTGPAITNKIRMATENCPLGKWKVEQVEKPVQSSRLWLPDRKPVLAGADYQKLVRPFGPMMPQAAVGMSRRRCCSSSSGDVYPCSICIPGTSPKQQYTVQISGITNGIYCSDCSILNDSFILNLDRIGYVTWPKVACYGYWFYEFDSSFCYGMEMLIFSIYYYFPDDDSNSPTFRITSYSDPPGSGGVTYDAWGWIGSGRIDCSSDSYSGGTHYDRTSYCNEEAATVIIS